MALNNYKNIIIEIKIILLCSFYAVTLLFLWAEAFSLFSETSNSLPLQAVGASDEVK